MTAPELYADRPVRVVVVSEIPTPYRLPLYRRLAERSELALEVLFCSPDQPNRPWKIDDQLAAVPHTMLPGFGLRFGGRRNTFVYEINPTIIGALRRRRPDLLVIGGYAVFAEQAAIAFARSRGIPYLLHSESQFLKTRSQLRTAIKRAVLPHVIGGAVGGLAVGSAAARYLEHYGIDRARIRIFPNTIDVPAYRTLGDTARSAAEEIRRTRNLPERFWLYAGRLVEAKGVLELAEAVRQLGDRALPLVVAGEGPLEDVLRELPGVTLLGFQQPHDVLELMALAELTIVPSRVEPWGVVVNEALASGSPVIVSDAVGAAEDLVMDGVNGRVFPAGDVRALTACLSAPPPPGARSPGAIDRWNYEFAEMQFLEAVALAVGG